MEPIFVIFAIISILLLIVLGYESRQLRKYNQQFEEVAEAVLTLGKAFNTNTDIQRNDRVVMREAIVDIAMVKAIVEIHAKVINIPIPKTEWEELLKVVKETGNG